MPRRGRAGWLVGVSLGAALAGSLVLLVVLRSRTPLTSSRVVSPAREGPPPVATPPPTGPAAARPPAGRGDALAPPPPDPDTEAAMRWAHVDLDEVREALPDNLYWKMSAPTDDPDVLRWREEERARWNVEYGKVLSGNATLEEIQGYYDLRQRISQDAATFADYLLLNYGSDLPERDVGLLQLASKLNRARLEEMPRRLAEAVARKQRQDRLREAWRKDEQAFEDAQREDAQRDAR